MRNIGGYSVIVDDPVASSLSTDHAAVETFNIDAMRCTIFPAVSASAVLSKNTLGLELSTIHARQHD